MRKRVFGFMRRPKSAYAFAQSGKGKGLPCTLTESLDTAKCMNCLFVCVEVLRPSQPNGVMSSAVSLPNHTFTEQA